MRDDALRLRVIPADQQYLIEPQRIVYAHGGIYLVAWVAEYGAMRTFAAERIETLGLMDGVFEPRALPAEPFADSMGVNTGTPERIVIEFDPHVAPFVREREWHRSQDMKDRTDGGLTLTLNVCRDHALLAWILGFGPDARVVSPPNLVMEIVDAVDRTRQRYVRTVRRASQIELLSMRAR